MDELHKDVTTQALFCVPAQGYENMAVNFGKVSLYIKQSVKVIDYYETKLFGGKGNGDPHTDRQRQDNHADP